MSRAIPVVAAYGVAAEVTKRAPQWTPFGDETHKGLLPGVPKEGEGWLSWFQSAKKETEKVDHSLEGLIGKMGTFGDSADLVGAKKIDPSLTVPGMDTAQRDLQKFFKLEIEAGHPITPYVTLSGVEAAQQQIATLINNIHALNSAGDHALPYVSGGGSSSAPPSKGGRQPAAVPRAALPGKVTLNVGGREFDAYVDERAGGSARREIDADRRFQRVKGGG